MKTAAPKSTQSFRGLESVKLGPQTRVFDFEIRQVLDEENRTIEVAFSSSEPVNRGWWTEILSHAPGAADLTRLNNSAPMLWMHDPTDQRGVVEPGTARIDKDGKGRCVLRFSKTEEGEKLWTDVRDQIVTKISFGYIIEEARLIEFNEETGLEIWEVTRWRALEVSCVSIPADDTVGMCRSAMENDSASLTKLEVPSAFRETPKQPQKRAPKMEQTAEEKLAASNEKLRLIEVERAAAATEDDRIDADRKEILAYGERYGVESMAAQFLAKSRSETNLADFKLEVIKRLEKPASTGTASLGMDEKEVKRYDLFKAIRASISKTQSARAEASYELDLSREMQEKLGAEPDGLFIPPDVTFADLRTSARVFGNGNPLTIDAFKRAQMMGGGMQRDVTVGGSAGNLKGTDMLGLSFIEVLRNAGRFLPECTMFTDLIGDVAIPRHSTATLAYWVAESGVPTEGAPVFDQVTLAPKTVGGYLDLSRKILKQSSVDIQAWAFAELAAVIGLALDAAGINGSGASNQPEGVLNTTGIGDIAGGTNGLAPTWAHIVAIKREVAKDNALLGSPKWFLNSDSIAKLEVTERASSTAAFILDADSPRQTMGGFPWCETNQVPNNIAKGSGTDLSALLFGNARDCIAGLWGVLDMVVDDSTFSSAGGLRISAFQDADIAVRHASSFSAMQDAITA